MLKNELSQVQHRMNELSLEKQQYMENFRLILIEKFVKKKKQKRRRNCLN